MRLGVDAIRFSARRLRADATRRNFRNIIACRPDRSRPAIRFYRVYIVNRLVRLDSRRGRLIGARALARVYRRAWARIRRDAVRRAFIHDREHKACTHAGTHGRFRTHPTCVSKLLRRSILRCCTSSIHLVARAKETPLSTFFSRRLDVVKLQNLQSSTSHVAIFYIK